MSHISFTIALFIYLVSASMAEPLENSFSGCWRWTSPCFRDCGWRLDPQNIPRNSGYRSRLQWCVVCWALPTQRNLDTFAESIHSLSLEECTPAGHPARCFSRWFRASHKLRLCYRWFMVRGFSSEVKQWNGECFEEAIFAKLPIRGSHSGYTTKFKITCTCISTYELFLTSLDISLF